MIKVNDVRYQEYDEVFPVQREETPSAALHGLLEYQIGFGGSVMDISETKVVVRTCVMNCVDVVSYEGTAEEMKLLVEAAYYSVVNDPMGRHAPQKYKDVVMDQIIKAAKGNLVFMKHGAGFIRGSFTTRAVLVAMIGDADEIEMTKLFKFNLETLLSICSLVRVDKVSVAEAIELALLEPVFGMDGKITGLTAPA